MHSTHPGVLGGRCDRDVTFALVATPRTYSDTVCWYPPLLLPSTYSLRPRPPLAVLRALWRFDDSFLKTVFAVFAENALSIDMVATSEVSISLTLDQAQDEKNLIR